MSDVGARAARAQAALEGIDRLGCSRRIDGDELVVDRGGVELVRVPATEAIDVVAETAMAAIRELANRRGSAAQGEA